MRLADEVMRLPEKDVSPAELAIRVGLAPGDDLVPIPGTKRRTYLDQNAGAVEVELIDDDLALDRCRASRGRRRASARPGWRT